MENLGERIVYAMEMRHLNPNKLSVRAKIHASTIKNYINNVGKPDESKLDKISNVLDISSDWLKNGIGEMELQNTAKPPLNIRNDDAMRTVSRMAKMLEDANEEIKRLRQKLDDLKSN